MRQNKHWLLDGGHRGLEEECLHGFQAAQVRIPSTLTFSWSNNLIPYSIMTYDEMEMEMEIPGSVVDDGILPCDVISYLD